ncbi:MAG: RES family NAD+ phosphorylase [Rubrivivax sp.]
MILWRIAADTRSYGADDLSGAGAAKSPGRWNDTGQPVVYAAPTIAMAVLETAAHIDDGGLPLNRYLVEITVPDATWKAREVLDQSRLDATWAAIPAGRGSVKPGSDWIKGGTAALLVVPSVIVPEESAVVINASHPDAAGLKARIVRLFEYNRLFRPA